jgi:hypothetical protein
MFKYLLKNSKYLKIYSTNKTNTLIKNNKNKNVLSPLIPFLWYIFMKKKKKIQNKDIL